MQKRDPKTNTGICVLEMTRRLGYKSIGSGISFKRAVKYFQGGGQAGFTSHNWTELAFLSSHYIM